VPGAIAAELARPDPPVVCLIGGECFQMTCGEVATAKRLGMVLPIVVLDDKWLAPIRLKQIRRQFPLYGTALQQEEYREPPAHRAGNCCPLSRSAGTTRRKRITRDRTNRDRSGGRFRTLSGNGLRLS
jgi:TPP-dependent trihydroxycyclohexane-1,2-dione (THcHDO) dehydratase